MEHRRRTLPAAVLLLLGGGVCASTTITAVPTIIPSPVPFSAPTAMPIPTPTAVPLPAPTVVPIPTPTAVPLPAPTAVPLPAPTVVPSPGPTHFPSPAPTSAPSSSTPTPVPSPGPSHYPTSVPSPVPSSPPSPRPTHAPSPMPSSRPTSTPSQAPSPMPTVLPSSTPTPVPSPRPSPIPTAVPTSTPSAAPTSSPTSQPSNAPTPVPTTAYPSVSPTPVPSTSPSPVPTPSPTPGPSPSPTATPTPNPTPAPTPEPTPLPSSEPSPIPTSTPTQRPSPNPTSVPSPLPSSAPTPVPTSLPSGVPSPSPTPSPTSTPTSRPSSTPTKVPTMSPTISPLPTSAPSEAPSPQPTAAPSREPTPTPTAAPSEVPTPVPSAVPSPVPTPAPSETPTPDPTGLPTAVPSPRPSTTPTPAPSEGPTPLPTPVPTYWIECPLGYAGNASSEGLYSSVQSYEEGCNECPQGYFANETGMTSCHRCPRGTTSNTTTVRHSCVSCERGYYAAEWASETCSECEVQCVSGSTVGGTCDPGTGTCVCYELYYGEDCSERHLIENSMYFGYITLMFVGLVVFPLVLASGKIPRWLVGVSEELEPVPVEIDWRHNDANRRKSGSLIGLALIPLILISDIVGNIIRLLVNASLLLGSLENVNLAPPDAFVRLYEALYQACVWLKFIIPVIDFPSLALLWEKMAVWLAFFDEWAMNLLVAAEVTCEGATLPLYLLFNTMLILFSVLLIESNLELALGSQARLAFGGKGVLKMVSEKANDTIRRSFYVFVQLLVSSVTYNIFTTTKPNAVCNAPDGIVPFDTAPHDTILAYISTVVAFASFPIFAHVLLHSFVWGYGAPSDESRAMQAGYYILRKKKANGGLESEGEGDGEEGGEPQRRKKGMCACRCLYCMCCCCVACLPRKLRKAKSVVGSPGSVGPVTEAEHQRKHGEGETPQNAHFCRRCVFCFFASPSPSNNGAGAGEAGGSATTPSEASKQPAAIAETAAVSGGEVMERAAATVHGRLDDGDGDLTGGVEVPLEYGFRDAESGLEFTMLNAMNSTNMTGTGEDAQHTRGPASPVTMKKVQSIKMLKREASVNNSTRDLVTLDQLQADDLDLVRDPGFFMNIPRCFRYYLKRPGAYVLCTLRKIPLLAKLTLGYWDEDLVRSMEIRELADRFDGGAHKLDVKWSLHQPIVESIGTSHSLFWQFFPLGMFVAKLGEATNHSPCFTPAEHSKFPLEMTGDAQLRFWPFCFDVTEYIMLVIFVTKPTAIAIFIILVLLLLHCIVMMFPYTADAMLSKWCFDILHVLRVVHKHLHRFWPSALMKQEAQAAAARLEEQQRREIMQRPPAPEVYQIGHRLEVFTDIRGSRGNVEKFELLVHPPVPYKPEPKACSGVYELTGIRPDRHLFYSVRVAWSSRAGLGMYSAATRVRVYDDVPPYAVSIKNVFDDADDPTRLHVKPGVMGGSKRAVRLNDLRTWLLSEICFFLDERDEVRLSNLVSYSVLQARRKGARFVARVEDEEGEPILPLFRPVHPDGTIHLDARFTGGSKCRVRLAMLSAEGTATEWSEAAAVTIGVHAACRQAIAELRGKLRDLPPSGWAEAILAAEKLRDSIRESATHLQRCSVGYKELKDAIAAGRTGLAHAQEYELLALPLAQSRGWLNIPTVDTWNGVRFNSDVLVTELRCSARVMATQGGGGGGSSSSVASPSSRRSSSRGGYRQLGGGGMQGSVAATTSESMKLEDLASILSHTLEIIDLSYHLRLTGNVMQLQPAVSLMTVNLSHSAVSGDIAAFMPMKRLATLDLAQTQVSGSIVSLRRCSHLRVVDLTSTMVTGTLRVVEKLLKLQELRLGNTGVTGKIDNLWHCRDLQLLDITNTNVHGNSQSLTKLPQLHTIRMGSTVVEAKYEWFAEAPNLRELDVRECHHVAGTPKGLKEAKPGLVLRLAAASGREIEVGSVEVQQPEVQPPQAPMTPTTAKAVAEAEKRLPAPPPPTPPMKTPSMLAVDGKGATGTGVQESKAEDPTFLAKATAAGDQPASTASFTPPEPVVLEVKAKTRTVPAAAVARLTSLQNKCREEDKDYNLVIAQDECDVGMMHIVGTELEKDEARGFALLKRASDKGLPEAHYRIARCFLLGLGTYASAEHAVAMLRRAAESNFIEAWTDLGIIHEKGMGVKCNVPDAVAMYQTASLAGSVRSAFLLGVCYAYGKGVKTNRRVALQHICIAAMQGHQKAAALLKDRWLWDGVERPDFNLLRRVIQQRTNIGTWSMENAKPKTSEADRASARRASVVGSRRASLASSPTPATSRSSHSGSTPRARDSLSAEVGGADEEKGGEADDEDMGTLARIMGHEDGGAGVANGKKKGAAMRRKFMPRTKPIFHIDLLVEVKYNPSIIIKDPSMTLSQVSRTFGPEMYLRAKITAVDRKKGSYELEFHDGPFYEDEDPNHAVKMFSENTTLHSVSQEYMRANLVDLMVHPPIFMVLISLLQIAQFVYYMVWTGEDFNLNSPVAGHPSLWFKLVGSTSSDLDYPACDDLRGEWWRFFSYQFVHSGVLHLALNIVLQLLLGIPLEMIHGTFRIAFLYELGIYMGALNVASVIPNQVVVGASAGMCAIVGVHFANLKINWKEMQHGSLTNWRVFILLLVILGLGLQQSGVMTGDWRDEMSHATHFGGFVSGFFSGILVLRRFETLRVSRKVSVLLAVLVMGVCVLHGSYWVFRPENFPPEVNPLVRRFLPVWHDDNACCWMALSCDGVQPPDYSEFACVASGSSTHLTASDLEVYTNVSHVSACSQMEAYLGAA